METALRSGQSEEKTRRRGLTWVFISAPRELLDSARMNSCSSRLTCLLRDRAASAPSLAGAGRESQRRTHARTRDTDPQLGGSRLASNPQPDPASNATATGKHLLQSWILRYTHRCRLLNVYSWKTNSHQALRILPPESRCVWLRRQHKHEIRAKWNLEKLWIAERVLCTDALIVN